MAASLLFLISCQTDAKMRATRPATVIDLVELYTPEAGNVEHKIRAAVDNLNKDIIRSGIAGVRFNLVYVGQIASAEEVVRVRDQYRADLAGVWSPNGSFALVPDRDNPQPFTGFHYIQSDQDIETHLLSHEIGHNLSLSHEDGVCIEQYRDIMSNCAGMTFLPPLVRFFAAAHVIRDIAPKIAAYR